MANPLDRDLKGCVVRLADFPIGKDLFYCRVGQGCEAGEMPKLYGKKGTYIYGHFMDDPTTNAQIFSEKVTEVVKESNTPESVFRFDGVEENLAEER